MWRLDGISLWNIIYIFYVLFQIVIYKVRRQCNGMYVQVICRTLLFTTFLAESLEKEEIKFSPCKNSEQLFT